MIDEKDLEIARLKGQIEALERVLAAMRALQPAFPSFPAPALPPGLVLPTEPYCTDHGGNCACAKCCPPMWGVAMTQGLLVGPGPQPSDVVFVTSPGSH